MSASSFIPYRATMGPDTQERSTDDLEKKAVTPIANEEAVSRSGGQKKEAVDIEHVPVRDDPRAWSKARKVPDLNSRFD